MKKGIIITSSTIGLIAVAFLLFHGRYAGDELSSLKPEQAAQYQEKSELIDSALSSDTLIDHLDDDASQKLTLQTQNAVSANSGNMDYDADWCIAATDLSPQDITYFKRELEDWNISRGRIIPAIRDGIGNVYLADSSQYIAPYMESSYDAIWEQIQVDNIFAMIAALNRHDIDIENQRKIAQRLVIKGYTATALSHLVMVELVNAKMMYERTGQINTDAEDHLYLALAYTAYGIKHFDLDAVFTYVRMVSSADFPPELKPLYSLGKDNRINDYIHRLEEFINKARVHENMILSAPEDIPKAARHDFESMLAYLYREYGYELNDLKVTLSDTTGAMLESTKCVQRQVDFFGDLERRARSRTK